MTCGFALFTDTVGRQKSSRRNAWAAGLILFVCCLLPLRAASANALARANAAYSRGDYVGVVRMLTPLALRGNANAQAFLGFMYENGYGAPQAYEAAVDLYIEAAMRGNPFGQCMLGLMYDKGHGVGRDVVLAYKWLNLAAARAPRRERDYFLRLRNAVASKMSPRADPRGSTPCVDLGSGASVTAGKIHVLGEGTVFLTETTSRVVKAEQGKICLSGEPPAAHQESHGSRPFCREGRPNAFRV